MSRPFSLDRLDEFYIRSQESTCNVFIRHDVDFSLDAALKMGRFEVEREIYSTYYLFNEEKWPFYTWDDANRAADKLSTMGHDIGYHINERWIDSPDTVHHLAGTKVSFHCPTDLVLWKDFGYFENAYDPRWEGHYVADSRGTFTYGDPEDMLHLYNLQVNIHPEWWVEPHWESRISYSDYEKYFYIKHPCAIEVL